MRVRLALIFAVILIASLFAMCTTQEEVPKVQKTPGQENRSETVATRNESNQVEESQTPQPLLFRIFYYYHPLCPNCQKIKPYMELMENVTEIDACNVGNLSACSPESIEMLKLLKSQGKFLGVPTIAVLEGSNVTLLIGWKQALKLGEIVERHGITPPPVTYNNITYTIQECVDCHQARGLKPPSTFSCTFCCHSG